jgi:hypothetical protein
MVPTYLSAQADKLTDMDEIQDVLQVFKRGYAERDTSKASAWCDRIFYDNVEIIGTYSVHPNSREWFSGKNKAVGVFANDWVAWGDLNAKVEDANINIDDNVAWVSIEATVTKSPRNSRARTAEQSASNILKHIAKLSEEDDDKTSRLKLMEAAYYANLVLYQYEQGDEFVWPIRISGVLQKQNGEWKIRQMHFSHPNRGFPNVRN